jgi:hypothetical protein
MNQTIGELDNLTTKIITLSELFSFVSEFSRLQYEWSSDCWCIWKSFEVNACLQWRKYYHFIGEVFLHSFFLLRICRGYFDCTCALAHQSLCAGIVYEHYCLCPGWPCARRSFKKVVYVHYVPWMLGCETKWPCNVINTEPFCTCPRFRPKLSTHFAKLIIVDHLTCTSERYSI